MRLFQYWDTGEPPDDVAGWIDGFRAMNPEMDHRLYDRDSAAWFIGKHLGERWRQAFEALLVPSMQSDYFRASAILAKGGCYVDADSKTKRPLRLLFETAPYALMLHWDNHFQPGFMMFRTPGDALVAAWLESITRKIEDRREANASMLTGPYALRQVTEAAKPGTLEHLSLTRVTPLAWADAGPWIGMPEPAYKSGPRHWKNWQGPIYAW